MVAHHIMLPLGKRVTVNSHVDVLHGEYWPIGKAFEIKRILSFRSTKIEGQWFGSWSYEGMREVPHLKEMNIKQR